MGEPLNGCELTAEARQAIALLRHGPQSLHGLAETLGLNLEQTQHVLQRLNRNVGIVRLFRSDTLRYGRLSRHRHSMNIIHDSYDNDSLDYSMITAYVWYQAVGRTDRTEEKKEIMMHTNGHTTIWETPIGVGRARDTKSWYQQLRDRWAAHKAARQQANLDALHRCWDAKREAVAPHRAEAAPDMAAAHHAISVATMLYGLAV